MKLVATSNRVGDRLTEYWYSRYDKFAKRDRIYYIARLDNEILEERWDTGLNDFHYALNNPDLYEVKVW